MKKVDCLIIRPGNPKKTYGALSSFNLTAIEPPLWTALLASNVRAKGLSVEVLDAEAEELTPEETALLAVSFNPELIVISVSGSNPSASTMNMTSARNTLESINNIFPNAKTILHGLHPSALPKQTLEEEKTDYVCQGEGFSTIVNLIFCLKGGCKVNKVDGLWYKVDKSTHSTNKSPITPDLDQLIQPAWDLLPMYKYRAHNWHCFGDIDNRQPYGVLYTSMGCPYNCSFCCINAIFGKPGIRFRSPEYIMNELDFLVQNYGIKNIKIIDEMFAINEQRVSQLCDLIIERKYDLNMWAYARVNTVTSKMLDKMKQAGINWIGYGFESGSERVLKSINKDYEFNKVLNIVEMTRSAGIYIGANFIFGLPEDNLQSMNETLDLAINLNTEWANFYYAIAYPGSKLYAEAIKNNWKLPDEWSHYSPYSYESLPLPTKYLTAKDVLRFRDEAFLSYFKNQEYLKTISKKFGGQTVTHIKGMTKVKLKRKILEN
jgi:radical SAM superfamily enzyme YgiQ (UPF0313 family)